LSAGTTIVPGPVTGDVDATGQVTDSLVVRVDGQRFDEVPSLYGRGANEPVYASKLAAETTRKREAEVATCVTRVSTLERELKAERRKRAEVERRRPSARMRRLLRSPITTIRRRLARRRPGASA